MKNSKIVITAIAMTTVLTTGIAYAESGKKDRGQRLEKMFERIDANKDGKLSLEESVQGATARFDNADTDKDGVISVDEMMASMERRRKERRARRMLNRMDYDGDGKVTKSEIESRARKRFALADGNNDGFIEKNEMRRSMRGFGRKRGGKENRHHRRKNRGSSEL